MSGKTHPMLDILEDIAPVSLRHTILEQGLERLQVFRNRSGLETLGMRRSLVIKGQLGVLGVGRIHTLSRLLKAFWDRRNSSAW